MTALREEGVEGGMKGVEGPLSDPLKMTEFPPTSPLEVEYAP
jgi:hypothetical protein